MAVVLAIAGVASGAAWTARGPESADVAAIAIDVADPQRAYVGTRGGGVFASNDAGVTWQASSAGLASGEIAALATAPNGALYAGTNGAGIAVSVDHGAHWTDVTANLPLLYVYAVGVDPGSGGKIYAGTGLGLYSAAPGGAWTLRGPNNSAIWITAVATPSAGRIIAGASDGRLFTSDDAGASWRWLTPSLGLGGRIGALVVDPFVPSTIFASTNFDVHRSTDGGATWTRLTSLGYPAALLADPSISGRWLAGTRQGIHVSTNGGNSWTLRDPSPIAVTGFAVDARNPTTILAGASFYGVFRSLDRGLTWPHTLEGITTGITNVRVEAMALAPSAPAVVYAVSSIGSTWRSNDGSRTWTLVTSLFANARGLVVDPTTPTRVYAATDGGVERSVDGGVTWRSGTWDPSNVVSVVFDRSAPRTLYAAASDGVHKSVDGADSWTQASLGPQGTPLAGLAIGPEGPGVLYAATYDGLYRSTDGAQTWSVAHDGLPTTSTFPHSPPSRVPVLSVAADAVTPGLAYAVIGFYGTFRTTDAAASWTRMPDLDGVTINAIFPAPDAAGVAYAATTSGVLRTVNAGATWSALPPGLFPADVLTVAAGGDVLLAGTNGGAVYALEPRCGDGTRDAGEDCDDGNVLDGDCCSSACRCDPAGTACAIGACDGLGVCVTTTTSTSTSTSTSSSSSTSSSTTESTSTSTSTSSSTSSTSSSSSSTSSSTTESTSTSSSTSSSSSSTSTSSSTSETTSTSTTTSSTSSSSSSTSTSTSTIETTSTSTTTSSTSSSSSSTSTSSSTTETTSTSTATSSTTPSSSSSTSSTSTTLAPRCGNGTVEAGEECDDGSATGQPESCCSATCRLRPVGTACADDGELCTRDACDASGVCAHAIAPAAACETPLVAKGATLLLQASSTGRTRAQFKWGRGPAVPIGDFGDPAAGDVGLCVYDQTAPDVFALALDASASTSGGGTWVGTPGRWRFRSITGEPDGVTGVVLKAADVPLRAKVQLKAMRDPVLLAGLPLRATSVVAQLRTSTGACWGATFSTAATNAPSRFKAKSD